MANFDYKNIDEILVAKGSIRGTRFFVPDINRRLVIPALFPANDIENPTRLELHAFLPNTAYIDGATLYDIPFQIETRNEVLENDEVVSRNYVIIDVHKHLHTDLNLPPGSYKVVYNFFRDIIGGASNPNRMFISDISSDRKELRLSLKNPDNEQSLDDLRRFVLAYFSSMVHQPPIVLNFGENKIVDVVNVASDGSSTHFYVKLYEELPADLDLYYECWVGSQILKPWIDNVLIIREDEVKQTPFIKGPNFEVDYDYWVTAETPYKSWNDILSANLQTSQEILNRYITNNGSSVKLNVDFREFKNFIFYSSAEERLANFFYKIELVEHYNGELDLLNSYTGSVSANKVNVTSLRDKVVNGFDDFEKWLYYETTASNYYTSQADATIIPYPKYEVTSSNYDIATKEGSYKLYSVSSSEALDWYSNIIDLATDYDMINHNSLNKSIPEHLRDSGENEQFTSFVNMVGQHFDILYLYTDHILKKNLREEHPKDGMSQDLIYEATKNLGWTLSHGTQAKDLWEYALGVSGSGSPIWTGKNTINKYLVKSEEERTKEVWRRILNNLPYIYKTKGTARSIKALLAAYGIPQTILTIREYGGPDNADLGVVPRTEWEKHTYYLNFSGSYPLPTRQHYVSVPWERVNNEEGNWQYPDTMTFRWRMEPNKLYDYSKDPEQTLLQKMSGSRLDWYVTMNKNGTDVEKGTLKFYIGDGSTYVTASISDEYFYDDVPINLYLGRRKSSDTLSENQIYDIIVKTAKYGKLAIEKSASIVVSGSVYPNYNRAWSSDGVLYIGSGSNPQTNKILSGSIYEMRYWSKILNTSSFDNHVLAARAYNGNTSTSSFYDLQAVWKFWQPFDLATTTSMASSHPDQRKNKFYTSPKNAYFYNFNSGAFESIVETYNMEVATVANNTPYTEKVRIDSASLLSGLKVDESFAVSNFDRYSIDSNKLMVAFSPQHIMNEDIYETIGNVAIDDFFGEYSNVDSDEYPRLKWFAREYWKKYPNKNDFNAYIRIISQFDFSVFDQIRQTLPLRTNEIVGLVVEPTVLERSKVKVNRDFSAENEVVVTTEEISKVPKPKAMYKSTRGTVLVGFDEDFGSNIEEISGEFEVVDEMEAELQDVEGEQNIVYKTIGNFNQTQTRLKVSNTSLLFNYEKYDTHISAKIKNIVSDIPNYYAGLFAGATVKGKVSFTDGISNIIVNTILVRPSSSYDRKNLVYKNTGINAGYGMGWVTQSNESSKYTTVFDQVGKSRTDGYYKKYNFFYSSAANFNSRIYSSSSLSDAEYINPEHLPIGIQNHRFNGSSLVGKNFEGINDIPIPAVTPDGGPIVEVNVISGLPNQLIGIKKYSSLIKK